MNIIILNLQQLNRKMATAFPWGRLQHLRSIYRLLFVSLAASVLFRLLLDSIQTIGIRSEGDTVTAMYDIIKWHNKFFPSDTFEPARGAFVFVVTVAIPSVAFLFSIGHHPRTSRRLGPFLALATVWLSSVFVANSLLGPGGFVVTTVFFNWVRALQCFSLALWKPAKASRSLTEDLTEEDDESTNLSGRSRKASGERWPLERDSAPAPVKVYLLATGMLLGLNSLWLTTYMIVMAVVLMLNLRFII